MLMKLSPDEGWIHEWMKKRGPQKIIFYILLTLFNTISLNTGERDMNQLANPFGFNLNCLDLFFQQHFKSNFWL
jgi:hypothetical protein